MWVYEQKTGHLYRGGVIVGAGYSGSPDGKNDPTKQDQAGVGPVPRGIYSIGAPADTETHGPFVMRLTPDTGNQMFGRDGFLIHGDSVKTPGTASHGCVIMPRAVREAIWASGDRRLLVVTQMKPKLQTAVAIGDSLAVQ